MESTHVNTPEDEEVLVAWKETFKTKHANLRCPHQNEHADFYEIKDLHVDHGGTFTYHVEACCPAFAMIVKPMVSEERLWNPPKLNRHQATVAPSHTLHPMPGSAPGPSASASTAAVSPAVRVNGGTHATAPQAEVGNRAVEIELRGAQDLTKVYKNIVVHESFVDFLAHGLKPRLYVDGHLFKDYYPAFFSESEKLCLVVDLAHL